MIHPKLIGYYVRGNMRRVEVVGPHGYSGDKYWAYDLSADCYVGTDMTLSEAVDLIRNRGGEVISAD
jgi:hypothetical protein